MAQAIAIIHHKGSTGWLDGLLDSIQTDYPIIISNHEGWCMDGIRKVFETTDYNEICILNESMIIKDNSIWDKIFKENEGKSVMLGVNYLMFFGKFRREKLPPFPEIHSKKDDVLLGELGWCGEYMKNDSYVEIQPMTDGYSVYEEKNGRNNMILENDYFKKYKGHWNLEMICD